jgi:hypothetical protein
MRQHSAGMPKLVKGTDLKSVGSGNRPYVFESRYPHHAVLKSAASVRGVPVRFRFRGPQLMKETVISCGVFQW